MRPRSKNRKERQEPGASRSQRTREPLTRTEIMKRVKQKNTGAEVALRSALHAGGLRFRLHRRIEGITVDIVFPGPRVAVLVDGCFWHGCPTHATYPKSNASYWLPKLQENKERDRRQTARLEHAGWKVIRVWEHDCRPVNRRVVTRIARACGKSRPGIGENGRSR
jgi:DNA mismatch endonuclease (patch repair protein)